MPQPLAAMSLKMLMPRILTRIGYRQVLLSNTAIIGMIIMLFALVHPGFPAWLIVVQAFGFGFFSSLQYTCMNSLVFADLTPEETSMESSIASAMQQMSTSFGVAVASLVAALFIGGHRSASSPEMTSALRHSFLVLGAMTVVSTLIFHQLRPADGASISSHKEAEAEAAGRDRRSHRASLAQHLRDDEDHHRAEESAAKEHVDDGVADGGHRHDDE